MQTRTSDHTKSRIRACAAGLTALVLVAAGCSDTTDPVEAAVGAAAQPAAPAEPVVDLTGTMTLEPTSGLPGSAVSISGEGLSPDTAYTLTWGSAEGRWDIQGDAGEEYHGRVYDPVTVTLASLKSDASGGLSGDFTVPDDFGFGHDVRLVDADGVVRNQALFTVEMDVRISPTSGPPGTPITIEVAGMGWKTLENNRTIVYDNAFAGWLSSVTTKGHATAVIPAVGAPGEHVLQVLRGAYTFPYLNPQQSPRPDIPTFDFVFTVTEGDPVLPASPEVQSPEAVLRADAASADGRWATTDYSQGPVGTPLTISGGGFSPGATIDFTWYRIVGNRVAGLGWEERALDFGSATAGADGGFTYATEVPGDVGGFHRIEASDGEETVATTGFTVTPSVFSISPEAGPVGTDISIRLQGVGWTETANIYTLVYDNSYLGYACGFNSQGDVQVTLRATGEPGWHFIDLYPAIYKGKETSGQQSFRIPQLNYADDHPGENLPAFHFAFLVEG